MLTKIKVGEKEYDLEDKDAALVEAIQLLTRALTGRRDG